MSLFSTAIRACGKLSMKLASSWLLVTSLKSSTKAALSVLYNTVRAIDVLYVKKKLKRRLLLLKTNFKMLPLQEASHKIISC